MPVGTFNINNRRYLGNKFKLFDFIERVVADFCQNVNVVADLFMHGCLQRRTERKSFLK